MGPASLPTKIVTGAILFCVPVLLAALAVPRFLQGARTEAFRSVVDSGALGERLSASSYRAAAAAYADTAPEDAEGLADRAQVLVLTAENDPATISRSRDLVIRSLLDAPSNPQAWLLFCQIEDRRTPQAAVACLDRAFTVSAFDWYTAGRRMSLAAVNWSFLNERVRNKAVSLVLPMWNSTGWTSGLTLRGALYDLSLSNEGRQLLRAGFATDREALRSFNRFVLDERFNGH